MTKWKKTSQQFFYASTIKHRWNEVNSVFYSRILTGEVDVLHPGLLYGVPGVHGHGGVGGLLGEPVVLRRGGALLALAARLKLAAAACENTQRIKSYYANILLLLAVGSVVRNCEGGGKDLQRYFELWESICWGHVCSYAVQGGSEGKCWYF